MSEQKYRTDRLVIILMSTVVFGLALIGMVWTVLQWRACLEAGLTTFYCIQHIS